MDSGLVLGTKYGFQINVENDLKSISTYSVLEQDGWFESEIDFLDKYLDPGMIVIDIGANVGFYTLKAAAKVGREGHVLSFEPGLVPATLLRKSLFINDFQNVTLIESAVGQKAGTAWMADNIRPELSRVQEEFSQDGRAVSVVTLDQIRIVEDLQSVDFIKIDAEGFEHAILLGGTEFLDNFSPVIMLEISEREPAATDLLIAKGFTQFRYLPFLECLIPHDWQGINKDESHLNAIFMKPDKAELLRTRGLAAWEDSSHTHTYPVADPEEFNRWFLETPFVYSAPELGALAVDNTDKAYCTACAEFLRASDKSLSLTERFVRLNRASSWANAAGDTDLSLGKALSMTRINFSIGYLDRYHKFLTSFNLASITQNNLNDELVDLFLPLTKKWDRTIIKNGDAKNWLCAMVIREMEITRSFSSMYTIDSPVVVYDYLKIAGYLDQTIERRAFMAAKCQNIRLKEPPAFMDTYNGPNADFWKMLVN